MTTKYAYPLIPNERDPKAHLIADLRVPDDADVPQAFVCDPCAQQAVAAGATSVHQTPVPPTARCQYCEQAIHARGHAAPDAPLVS